MSEFFIRRPIVAIVISMLMVIIGAITIAGLPVAQFPDIAPPEIRIHALYPGADSETMERAVATPIEQQVNGVDNMDYMYSLNSSGDSSTSLMVDFDLKTDPNTDLILTQSRQQLANGQLPQDVNMIGIDVKKSLTSPMLVVALYSPKGTYDTQFLANYAYINWKDPIERSYGVGQSQVYAGECAMRIWVKPDRLAKLGVTVNEVIGAVQAQNSVNPAGQVAGEPSVGVQRFTYTLRAQGRLATPEEFGNIVVRESPAGGVVRVKDVASVELGSQDYNISTRLNGKPCAGIGIYQLPGSNAVEAAKGIRKLLAKMKESFPADMDYTIALDTTGCGYGRHGGDRRHARDRLCFGDHRGLHIPARLARHRHSHAGRARLPYRNIRCLPPLRFLDQHAFTVWISAGHRPCGGRRDRRGGRYPTAHRRGSVSKRGVSKSDD
jgi:HAE1 family hydrophobic/amphiphilic exporter-1